jgi:hypothetical protein
MRPRVHAPVLKGTAMAKIKGQFKVDPPGCRHEVRIMEFNSVTMKAEGKCALCGAPANVEFTLDPPPATLQTGVKRWTRRGQTRRGQTGNVPHQEGMLGNVARLIHWGTFRLSSQACPLKPSGIATPN